MIVDVDLVMIVAVVVESSVVVSSGAVAVPVIGVGRRESGRASDHRRP